MKRIILYFLIVFTLNSLEAQQVKKVLFLGNSYTGFNNLPNMVSNMASNTGDSLIYDSNTPGGARFLNHSSNATSLTKMKANNWDFVTLQAQSQETSWSQAQMQAQVFPHAKSLCDSIRSANECAQPLFYMTWGRKNGDAVNCQFVPWVCTYLGMDSAIRATYLYMADTNNALVSPVGAIWRHLRSTSPNIDLYTADNSHPSAACSYAAACSFYTMIFKKDPTNISWNFNLNPAIADTIRNAAKIIVYDSLERWNFTNKVKANFTDSIVSNRVYFTNNSQHYDSLHWDFGDGSTSTMANPVHNYRSLGNFTPRLIAIKCGKADTLSISINILTLSLNEQELNKLSIFPNPAQNKLYLGLNNAYLSVRYQIRDIQAKLILEGTYNSSVDDGINIAELKDGIYFFTIESKEGIINKKFIKAE